MHNEELMKEGSVLLGESDQCVCVCREKAYLASLKIRERLFGPEDYGRGGGGGVLQAETRMKDIQAQGRGNEQYKNGK